MTPATAANTGAFVQARHVRRPSHGRALRSHVSGIAICITTLGSFRCVRTGADVREVRHDAVLASVVVLAAIREIIHRRELLEFFRDAPDGDRTLAGVLDRIRTHLGPWADESDEEIRIASGLHSDVGSFLAAFHAGRYADAAAIYAGPFLPGFEERCTPAFARWIRHMREYLAMLHQTARERARLCAMVEALGDAVILRSGAATVYCSEGSDLSGEAGLGAELQRLANELRREPSPYVFATARQVTAGGRQFRVSGCLLPEAEESSRPLCLFAVRRLSPTWPSDEDLARKFGLTRKECRVAHMLAHGSTNAEIARTLFISPHTARHHTENILMKLGLSSRARVATVILQAASHPAAKRATSPSSSPGLPARR